MSKGWTVVLAFFLLVNTALISYRLGVAAGRAEMASPTSTPSASVSAEGGGKLELAPATIEIGKIRQGEERTATLTYTNVGSAPLDIVDLDSSCGCTVPELSKRRLEPGEAGEMTIVFKAGQSSGPFDRTVTILYGNDQKEVLHVVGEVEAVLVFNPPGVRLKKGDSMKFVVQGVDPKRPFKVRRVDIPIAGIEVRQLGALTETSYEYEVRLVKDLPATGGKGAFPVSFVTDLTSLVYKFYVVPIK